MDVPPNHRTLAKYLKSILGGEIRVVTFGDEAEASSVAILHAPGSPREGVTTHATIGLSDLDSQLIVDGAPLSVELLLAARDEFAAAANILSTCAFNAINSGAPLVPDAIQLDVVAMYRKDTAMRHIMLYDPFLWPVEKQRLPDRTVAWLLALPISDSERRHVDRHGPAALATLFEQAQIDVFDLDRESIV